MSSKRALRGILLFCTGSLWASAASADNEGFAINRFEPGERGTDWFSLDSLNIGGSPRFAAGLTADWAHQPLVLYDENDDEVASILQDQVFLHLGASVTLAERFRLGVNVPLGLYSGGDVGTLGTTTFDSDEGVSFGDLRFAADARIWGEYRAPFSLAAGLWVWAPTGSQESFTGDGKVRLSPHVMAAGDIDMFAYAARLGFDYRAQQQDFGGSELGSDLTLGASAGVRLLDEKLLVGPEVNLSTGVESSDAFFGRTTTPLELIVGAHYTFLRDFRVGAGFGPGLTRGIGTPEFRGLLSLDWVQHVEEPQPAAAPADLDGDGVLDYDDACPGDPGERTDDPSTNGCPPPPPDRDGDGIVDDEDACPDQSGVASDDPEKHGCPLPDDADGDGILDAADACPNESGIETDDPKTNGCPPPKDTDQDTIVDPEDACPTVKGEPNEDPKKHGCPAARVEQGQIRILERVEFEYNSAKIEKGSERILRAVLAILEERPDITKLSVEGHTDDRGNDEYNKTLSRRRAQAVVDWLVTEGIPKKRLMAVGYGEERPIDSNESAGGRQNNRRVEFHIVEIDGKPAPKESGVKGGSNGR